MAKNKTKDREGSKHLNHKIDEKSSNYFEAVFQGDHWTHHEESNDYGIDYRVDLMVDEDPSGIYFFAQLKGQDKSKCSADGSYISYSLKIERLKQYCEMDAPVYLVVVDLSTKQGYWAYLQRYASEKLDPTWKTKTSGTVTIRVPTSNLISDTERMIAELRQNRRYQSLYTINRTIEEYKAMDSRCDIEVSASGKTSTILIKPTTGFKFEYSLDRKAIGEEEFDKFLRGQPITVVPGSIQATGSPLIEHIFERLSTTGGKFHFTLKQSVSLTLKRIGPKGEVRRILENLACELEGGPLEMRFVATTPSKVITIKGTRSPQDGKVHHRFTLNTEVWIGRPIKNLPLFDTVCDLIFGDCDDDNLHIVSEDDHEKADIVPTCYFVDFKQKLGSVISSLKAARYIATQQRINPVLPDKVSSQEWSNIEFLSRLFDGVDVMDGPFNWVEANFSKDVLLDILELHRKQEPINLALEGEVVKDFFGETVTILGCKRFVHNVRLLGDVDAIQKHVSESDEPLRLGRVDG